MNANYPGICSRCDRPINVGDRIIALYRKDYIHAACASGADE